jgi:Thioredoxin like C-terminal domain
MLSASISGSRPSPWMGPFVFTGTMNHVNEDERWIQDLLKERNEQQTFPGGIVSVQAQGAEAAPDMDDVKSPETYVGYERAQHFASPGGLNQGDPQLYPIPRRLELNQWALAVKWIEQAQIVLGPSADVKPVRLRVTIDGKAPGENHGADTDDKGMAPSPRTAYINWYDRRARSPTIHSRSSSSIPECRPSPSPSGRQSRHPVHLTTSRRRS